MDMSRNKEGNKVKQVHDAGSPEDQEAIILTRWAYVSSAG